MMVVLEGEKMATGRYYSGSVVRLHLESQVPRLSPPVLQIADFDDYDGVKDLNPV